MICISVGERTIKDCIEALKGVELAEIRLDMLEEGELTAENIKKLFSSGRKLIATYRDGRVDGERINDERRLKLLSEAIEGGASYVDIDVEAKDSYKKKLVEKARTDGCKVIVSYHDYKRTPATGELKQIIKWCFDSGADIAKIACMVNSKEDNARLLGLLDSDKKLIVVGMGVEGRLTRIVAPLLGSEFTFASCEKGKETAEGQLDKDALARAIKTLRDVVGETNE